MALDHYVSQVHLRKFYSPPPDQRLYAVRKRDGYAFRARSEDVCRIEEHSTNPFLAEERAIEEFLRLIEPRYNDAISKIRNGDLDSDSILVVAGFTAYVSTCSPAAMRLHTAATQEILTTTTNVLDAAGQLPPPPEIVGTASITELIEQGRIRLQVDPKFPQAIGIANILELTSRFGSAKWDIIRNDEPGSPFFTSDFPVAIDTSVDARALARVVPLAPDLAVRIIPEVGRDGRELDLTFSGTRVRYVDAPRSEIRHVNKLLVQCAESLVFFCQEFEWTRPFIEKYRCYRTEITNQRIPASGGGFYQLFGHTIRRFS